MHFIPELRRGSTTCDFGDSLSFEPSRSLRLGGGLRFEPNGNRFPSGVFTFGMCFFLEPLFPAISCTHCLLWLDSLTHVDFSVTYVSTAYHTLVVLCHMENEYWLPDRLRVSSVPSSVSLHCA